MAIEERLIPTVYESQDVLAQYPGPSTNRRYATIPSVGVFKWYINDTTTADGVSVVEPSGGTPGRWRLMASITSPGGSAESLPNSNSTLSSTQRRAVRTTTPTAERTYTVPDGTVAGERRTVERTDTTIFRMRVVDSGGDTVAWLNGPGQVEVAWDGTTWRPVGRDIPERILTPYDFGGVGDGSTDDAVALQAWLDALSVASQPCIGHLPVGVWKTTVPLTIDGGGDNFHSVTITGRNGRSNGALGSKIVYDGSNTDEAVLTGIGLVGSIIRDIIINANSKAKYGLLLHIESGVDESSSGILVENCSVYYPRDISGAACIGIGPETPTPATQTDSVVFRNCLLTAGATRATNADCWKTNQNGNTKDFVFDGVLCANGRRGANWELSSGSFEVRGRSGFDNCGVDIYQGGAGALIVDGVQSERSGKAIIAGNGVASTHLRGWEWHGATDNTDIVAEIGTSGRIEGCQFQNTRAGASITGVDTGTDVFTYSAREEGALADDVPLYVWSTGTLPAGVPLDTSYPGPGEKSTLLYTHSASGNTCELATGTGGSGALNITGSGTGTITFQSQAKIKVATPQQSTAPQSMVSVGNWYRAAWDRVSILDGSSNDVTSALYAGGSNIASCVTSTHDFGGVAGALCRLRPMEGWAPDYAQYQVRNRLPANIPLQHLYSGKPARTIHKLRLHYSRLIDNLAFSLLYVQIPKRTRVCNVIVDVTTAFGAAGTLVLEVSDSASGYPSGDLLLSHNIKATGTKGIADADMGAKLIRATRTHPVGHIPASGWSAAWDVLIAVTSGTGNIGNGTVTNLTNGQADIYIETESVP